MSKIKIKIRDVRLDSVNYYKSGHGTTWAGIMKSIATAIENPLDDIVYEDADTNHLALLAIFDTILSTNPIIKKNLIIVKFTGTENSNSVLLRYCKS